MSFKGFKHTQKTKNKISKATKGKNNPMYGTHFIVSEETKKKISKTSKGKIIPEKTRKKISNSLKGRILTKEWRHKLSIANLGKTMSEKTKRKISKTSKGKIISEETKIKMSLASKGKPKSEETKRKISIAKKGKKLPKTSGKNHYKFNELTPLNKQIRKCLEYNQWRSDIFTKDNFTCQKCNKKGIYIHAHHKKRFSTIIKENNIKTLKEALDCKELWNIKNGITLCKKCHRKIHKHQISQPQFMSSY